MILLIQPLAKESGKLNYPPFGLMAVAALPDSRGENIKILDGNVLNNKEIMREIDRCRPEIIGFTTFTGSMLKNVLELSRYVKKRKDALVVWGGVHASLAPWQAIKEDCVDVVVIGEGDYTFDEIIQRKDDLESVEGIIYKNKRGEIIENKMRPLIDDLEKLPPTPWHLIDVEKYCIPWMGVRKTLPVISSRGCPFDCAFCYNKAFNKMEWRPFSLKRVFSEIDYLIDRFGIEGVRLDASDNFIGTDKDRAIGIIRYVKSKNIKFSIQVRVRDIDRPFLDELKNDGCGYLFFGIESGSPAMRRYLNKQFDTGQAIETINYADKIGLRCGAGFLFDILGETDEDFAMSRYMMKKINCLVQLNAIQPFPGAKLYEDIKNTNCFKIPENTIEWSRFNFWNVHGISKIKNIKKLGRLWRFKINYLDNLVLCIRKKDFFMIKTMTTNFIAQLIKIAMNKIVS